MARRLFTVLSVLSLLLCVAVVVLWVRSYWVYDVVRWNRLQLSGVRGGLLVASLTSEGRQSGEFDPMVAPGLTHERFPPDDGTAWDGGGPEKDWHVAGLRYREGAIFGSFYARALAVPYWLLLVVGSTPFAGWLSVTRRRRMRERRRQGNLCASCGFDLRATPGRCPECGTPAAGKEA
jgi:hypothetical protein